MATTTNRLAGEHSPYLLQHQHNPVDWRPWGEEDFAAARREDKPIFLSIGYAACHWCHVMERESFENEEIARLMNEAFINVKVDREERPDVDAIYMSVCQALTGSGGWPLTIVMTPEAKPFFAATYIPPVTRQGRLGMADLAPRLRQVWRAERDRIYASADHIAAGLAAEARHSAAAEADFLPLEDAAFRQLAGRYDAVHGGFGSAPKFPSPHTLMFLLRYGLRSGGDAARDMAAHTLRAMQRGGIFDQIGYGFHRYATDAHWLAPHFEKMLYDQAMLCLAYTEGRQAVGDASFAETARQIAAYVLRDLRSPEGGFYASEDADSEGVEGKFYVWTAQELADVLGAEQAEAAAAFFGATAEGNFRDEATGERTGANILRRAASDAPPPEDWRRRLFLRRALRPRPGLDDKILTDWNGLMIAALARCGAVLGDEAALEAAVGAARFVREHLQDAGGNLLHRWRRGAAGIHGMLDDYAFYIWGLIELYEAAFETPYLEQAATLAEHVLLHFSREGGGFYLTPDYGEPLLVRPAEYYDGALPSGNAVMLLNLARLGRLTGRDAFSDEAHRQAKHLAAVAAAHPSGYTAALLGLDFLAGPSSEVVITAPAYDAEVRACLAVLHGVFAPNKVLLLRTPDTEAADRLAPLAAMQYPEGAGLAVYVCRNYACQAPTSDPQEAARLLTQP